jgi:hypothetical protein
MCISPRRLITGVLTACHECWQCREHAVLDWVGRNIAESKTARASSAITLTYGRNDANDVHHERSVILTYSDIQKYLKLLRRHGYPVRYFVTGENGSKKGRAHWHIIMYWQERVPDHVLDKNFMEEHWPHGWSFWTKLRPHSAKYNCKYILKDWTDSQSQSHLAMSKKPPLGAEFFQQRALQYVQQGLAPQDLFYTFPEAKQRNRQGGHDFMKFMLGGRSAELFLRGYIDLWARERGNKPRPKSELVDRFEKYGRVVSDSLLETLVDEEWGYRDKQAKRDARQAAGWHMSREDWFDEWIRKAPDGEERQRRREEFEWQRELWEQKRRDGVWDEGEHEYERKRAEYGTYWPSWEEWCADNLRSRPDLRGKSASGSLGGTQPDPRRNARIDYIGGRQQSGASGGHVPGDALGPIGTYNRNFAGSAEDGSEAA